MNTHTVGLFTAGHMSAGERSSMSPNLHQRQRQHEGLLNGQDQKWTDGDIDVRGSGQFRASWERHRK